MTTDYDAPRRSTLQDVDTETPEARLSNTIVGAYGRGGLSTMAMPIPGMPKWWFVGVTTAPTKRGTQVGRGVPARPGLVERLPTAGLVGNVVTARGESWPLATPTGPCLRRV